MSRDKSRITLIIVTVTLTVAFLVPLATNTAPWLRGPDFWRWPYAIPGTLERLWLPALLLVLYVPVAWWLLLRKEDVPGTRLTRRKIVLAIAVSALMTPAVQLALLYMDHPDPRSQLFYRTASENANGFFNVGAVVMDRYDFVRYFPDRMLTWYPTHPERHPPGLPLLFSFARQFFDATPRLTGWLNEIYRPYQCHNISLMNLPDGAIASATIQMVLPFVLGLVSWPLYLLGREMYDPAAAVRAVLLWPLMPGIALWIPFWTTLYALFAVVALLLFHYGLSRHKAIFFYLAGGVISFGSFLSFGNVGIVTFLGVYALVWLGATASRPRWGWLFWGAFLFVLGFATLWVVVWQRYDLDVFAVWRKGLGKHLEMNRVGWFWILFHLYDFFVSSVSIPVMVFWAVCTGMALRETWVRRRPVDLLAITFLLGLLVLDLSGTARGEVARVWAFLVPLPMLVAVGRLSRRRFVYVSLLSLLALHLFVNNVFIRYIGTDLTDPPTPPPEAAEAMDPETWLATWEGGISLESARVPETAVDGQPVIIGTTWTTSRQLTRAYTVFLHLHDGGGKLVAQGDAMPLQGEWPTTCWDPGQHFDDSYSLVIFEPLRTGTYRATMGIYYLPTGERLSISGQDAQTIDLGTIQVIERGGS
jgi:hypothetical protein